MLIAHASDLHGNYKRKLSSINVPDLWIISGDFFPNYGRGPYTNNRIDPDYELNYQLRWWENHAAPIMECLRGAPVIWVGGNHDFVSLVPMLSQWAYDGEAYDLSHGPATVHGKVFAGFSEIPYIRGEWVGETHGFEDIVRNVMEQNPDILVTHAPPAGILDKSGYGHCGISELTTALTYAPHQISHHFFGHVHNDGGKTLQEMGITFVNSAENVQTIVL